MSKKYINYGKAFSYLVKLLSEKNSQDIANEMYRIAKSLQLELHKENLSNKTVVNVNDFFYSVELLNEEKSHVIVKIKHKTIRYYQDTFFFEYVGI